VNITVVCPKIDLFVFWDALTTPCSDGLNRLGGLPKMLELWLLEGDYSGLFGRMFANTEVFGGTTVLVAELSTV